MDLSVFFIGVLLIIGLLGLLISIGILMEYRYRDIKRKLQILREEQKFVHKKEYILCAAIKRKIPIKVMIQNYKTNSLEDDDIYSIEIGRRHNDILARFGKANLDIIKQGFYTSYGRFVNREEALQIAKDAGQIQETNSELLFSEDLY